MGCRLNFHREKPARWNSKKKRLSQCSFGSWKSRVHLTSCRTRFFVRQAASGVCGRFRKEGGGVQVVTIRAGQTVEVVLQCLVQAVSECPLSQWTTNERPKPTGAIFEWEAGLLPCLFAERMPLHNAQLDVSNLGCPALGS